jgi:predicted HicB family RNase H-like nuclease
LYIADIIGAMPTKKPKELGVYIRLNPAEREAVHIAAKREERSLADWVRRSARKQLRELGLLPDIEDELKESLKKEQ